MLAKILLSVLASRLTSAASSRPGLWVVTSLHFGEWELWVASCSVSGRNPSSSSAVCLVSMVLVMVWGEGLYPCPALEAFLVSKVSFMLPVGGGLGRDTLPFEYVTLCDPEARSPLVVVGNVLCHHLYVVGGSSLPM